MKHLFIQNIFPMTPFYIEEIKGNRGYLHGEEARHCLKVMRKKVGDEIIAIDGHGYMYVCRFAEASKDKVALDILTRHADWGEKSQRVTLLISPLHKPDRFEWLIEKAVELGATDIIPYVGTHTVKTGVRVDRMERICVAALKQCMRSRLPALHAPTDFEAALKLAQGSVKLIGHAEHGLPIGQLSIDWQTVDSIAILIGPEGDFSHEEVTHAIENGYKPVLLGNNRLRSETAAIHLLGIAKHLLQF
jgi:16S rRNA (uracil1498-N3)-methyltransferase